VQATWQLRRALMWRISAALSDLKAREGNQPAQPRADPGCSEGWWLVYRGLTREAQWSQADSTATLHTMAYTHCRSRSLSKLSRNDRSFAFANTGKYRSSTEVRPHQLVQRKCEPLAQRNVEHEAGFSSDAPQ